MAQERDDLVYLAKLAEQAERFDEMVERRRCTYATRRGLKGGGGRPAIPRDGPEPRDRRKSRERETRRAPHAGRASKNLYQSPRPRRLPVAELSWSWGDGV